MFKKTITRYFILFVAAVLMISANAFPALAYSAFPDVPGDAPYIEEVNTLAEYGIFKGDDHGNFNPANPISRAETAALLVRIFVDGGVPTPNASSFTDVSLTHWALGYIEIAVHYGVINGYGDGRFGPADSLTYNQAVALLVRSFGLGELAAEMGGWPGGYIALADDLGITANTVNTGDAPVTRSTFAVLLYNGLFDPAQNGASPGVVDTSDAIQATIAMVGGGEIVLELYPNLAPQSVRNFVYLARQGFYDGLKFHRLMNGFMIQGGCPQGLGTGGPGYSIFGEFSVNGFENNLSHTRGVISMARGGHDFNSAGSQFFIVHEDSTFLDGEYAAFGKVVSGMDVVDRLADTPNDGPNGSVAPEDMPVILTITIGSDVVLPEPNRLPG